MDETLAETLTANLKHAKTQEAKTDALVLAMIALVDASLKDSAMVRTMWEDRGRAMWIGRAVYGFATAGGLAVIIKCMKCAGVI